jgi:hypothetical protein
MCAFALGTAAKSVAECGADFYAENAARLRHPVEETRGAPTI